MYKTHNELDENHIPLRIMRFYIYQICNTSFDKLKITKTLCMNKRKLYKQTLFKMSSRGVRIHIAIFMSDTHRKLSKKCVKRRCSAFIPHFYVFWKGVMTLLFMFLCILEMCNYSFLIGVYVPFSALLRLLAHFQLYKYRGY